MVHLARMRASTLSFSESKSIIPFASAKVKLDTLVHSVFPYLYLRYIPPDVSFDPHSFVCLFVLLFYYGM
jgi:hypothetical protein